MSRSPALLSRIVTALGVAAMLAFGTHAAVASPASATCPGGSSGWIPFSCTVGAAGNSYCDFQCKREIGSESIGECFGSPVGSEGCCLCTL